MQRKVFIIVKKGVVYFFFLSIISTIIFRFVPVPFTPLMLIRTVEYALEGKPIGIKYCWKSKKKISHNIQLAVVAAEDQKFYKHHGFDIEAIKKAMLYNKKTTHKLKGGSTISQQCAKNVFLWQGRNWIRKGLEVYFTLLIELFWSKERILEVYLNVIEMGVGVYGVEAASNYYYNKNAKNLTKEEAAGLVAILPNPRKWNPNDRHKKKKWILKQVKGIAHL